MPRSCHGWKNTRHSAERTSMSRDGAIRPDRKPAVAITSTSSQTPATSKITQEKSNDCHTPVPVFDFQSTFT
jgi:hypothetical protein